MGHSKSAETSAIYRYASLNPASAVESLRSSIKGLSDKEAKKRLAEHGFNELKGEKNRTLEILIRQVQSPFIYILTLAAFLALFLGSAFDAGLIVLFILINTALGFYQEFRSEQALKLLRQYLRLNAKVIRNEKQVIIPSREVVPGDILIVETGDVVSADLKLLEDTDITVDESTLTGESIPIHKDSSLAQRAPKSIYDLNNIVFAGTTIVQGSARGIAVATGKNTEFGQIKKLTTETVKESIFTKGIAKFSSFILKLTIITLIFVFLANLAIKGREANIGELLIFSIALAVSVIPEALPIVTTLSFSRGAVRLAKKKVITKRLSAIEDLGSIEILCTDKTGTITENKLKIHGFFPATNTSDLLLHANLAGAFFRQSFDAFDIAVKNALSEESSRHMSKTLGNFQQLAFFAFDPKRRRNSIVVRNIHGEELLIVRGAPEEMMDISSNLTAKERIDFTHWMEKEGLEGRRVLAIATKKVSETSYKDAATLEKHLHFEGCISFVDPIKHSTIPAIKKAKFFGIGVKIITGDSKEVAASVAKEIGLLNEEALTVLTADFLKLSKSKQERLLPHVVAFARTDPLQKHQLIQLLQTHYEVGFLGEGINDSPALKAAGVSIVVQSASDIAREAADIILLEKNLSVIIDGIEEGRKIFSNTEKYMKATLASNFGNFYAVAVGSLFINFLPMLPVQLLLVNLLSDFPMVAVATDKVDLQEIKEPTKYNVKDIVLIATILGIVSTLFDFMFFGLFFKMAPGILQTNWFIGSILTELAFLFSIRTKLPFYKASFPSKTVLFLTAFGFLGTIILPYTPIGQNVFHFTQPSTEHLFLIFSLVILYFTCSEIVKNVYYRVVEPSKPVKIAKHGK